MSKVSAAGASPAILPLSLLEALRNLDTPVGDGLDEVAGEIVAKRFGLSGTVAAQIERYQDAARRGFPIPSDETVSVFRLVGRRSDAALVFADAGRRAARHAARDIALPTRLLIRVMPGFVGRRVGAHAAIRAAQRVFAASLVIRGRSADAVIPQPLSLAAMAEGQACSFYGAALAELLRALTGFEGAMVHRQCRGRGDHTCRWHAAAVEGYS